MPHMVLPAACRSVVIAADNDEAGQRAAEEAAKAFRRRGVAAFIHSPEYGFKDFNDALCTYVKSPEFGDYSDWGISA